MPPLARQPERKAATMIDCVLIIVAYRSGTDLPALIESVPAAVGGRSWQAIVVNNDTSDDIAPLLAPYTRVTLVNANGNLGYSGGLNLGLRSAPESRFIAFLNPDLLLDPGSLDALAGAAGMGAVVAAVPVILDAEGRQHPSLRREPTILGSLGEALFGDRWPTRPLWLTEVLRGEIRYSRPASIDWATGAALLVRTETIGRVGDWDAARFFLYSEETDYCRRIRELGGVIAFTPAAVVRHRGAGSGSSPRLDALLEVNKVRYFAKWHGRASTAVFAAVSLLHSGLRSFRPSGRLALTAILSRGARDGLPGGVR